MRLAHTSLALALLLGTAAMPSMAMAETPPAVQAFLDNIARQTALKPAYDALTSDGSGNAKITNLTLSQPQSAAAPGMTLKVAEVTFSGISEKGPSFYEVGSARFDGMSITVTGDGADFTATMPQASAEGWYIRALGANPTPVEQLLATSSFARKMSSGKVSINAGGQTLSIDGAESTWNGDPNTGAGTFDLKVSNIAIPEQALAMIDQGGMLKQLGYTSLNLDIATTADMKVTGEMVGYDFKLGLTGRDIATLTVGAELADIPLQVYAAVMKAHSEGKEPDYNALMPQMQGILLNGASLRFEDRSIVNKLLPMMAAMQGMDEKTFRASIGPMVQLTLVQLQNEAFTKQAMEAVTAFFASPKSLTISAAPPAAVKLTELGTMDPNKPGEAITRLGITVTAND